SVGCAGGSLSRRRRVGGGEHPPAPPRRGVPPKRRRLILCADACQLPFRRGTFDLVNASLMVGDLRDLPGWSHEIARVLSVGGHLVYSDFHPSWRENGWQRTFKDRNGV